MLETAYKQYLESLSEGDIPLSRIEFLEKLKMDDQMNRLYGKNITRLMDLGERLEIAYPDREERMQTLIFMGTNPTKELLKRLKIPRRKIFRNELEINRFLAKDNTKKTNSTK